MLCVTDLYFRDITDMIFQGHSSSKVFQTLYHYDLALGLPIHTRFDDLDAVSRSQVCYKHKLQIAF